MFRLVDSYQHMFANRLHVKWVYQHEKVGEKGSENRGKLCCRQQFANVFADWFCANFSFRVKAAYFAGLCNKYYVTE